MKVQKVKNIILLLLLNFNYSNAQYNEWTWVNGNNTQFGVNVLGTKGVPNANNTPRYSYESAEWTDLNGNFWLITEEGYFWKYDPVTNMWTWMNSGFAVYGTQGIPSPATYPGEHGLGALTWTDNNNNLWLYGGFGDNNLNENLWKYDIVTNEWTWMKGPGFAGCSPRVYGTLGVAAPTNEPGSRAETSVSWKDANGDLWFFGGQACNPSANGALSDIWKYEVATNNWIWMDGVNTNNQPINYGTQGISAPTNTTGARYAYAGSEFYNGAVLFYGGPSTNPGATTPTNFNNDLWKYDITTQEWTWLKGSNAINQPAVFGTKCVPNSNNVPGSGLETRSRWTDDCGNLWLFCTKAANDLWRYSLKNNNWTWVSGTNLNNHAGVFGTKGVSSPLNIPPSALIGANAWKHNNDFYLFGGNDTWNTLWKYTPDKPTASFTLDSLIGCTPITASFSNNSSPGCNEIKSYLWNFGDPGSGTNDTSTLIKPTHVYNTAGNYIVQLIVTNCTGSKDTSSQSISITNQNTTVSQSITICTGQNYTLPGGSIVNTTGTYVDTINTSSGCDSIITTNLTVTNVITSSQNQTICSGQSYTLPGGSIVNTAGTYIDTISLDNRCLVETLTLTLIVMVGMKVLKRMTKLQVLLEHT